jgi:hypothetical protein
VARRKPQRRRREPPPPSKDASRIPLLGGALAVFALLWWAQLAFSGPSTLRLVFAIGASVFALLTLAPLLVQRGIVRLIRARRGRRRS